jgi:hypothetical protein
VQQEDRQRSYRVGYARVSTFEQIMDLQQDALREAGCSRIFTDQVSGAHITVVFRVGAHTLGPLLRTTLGHIGGHVYLSTLRKQRQALLDVLETLFTGQPLYPAFA